jgi:regulator of ribosome biosynthesis
METGQTNYAFDLGILTLSDSNPLKCDFTLPTFNKELQQQTLENIKRMVNSLYALKLTKDQKFDDIPDEYQVIDFNQSQFEVALPDIKTAFPRHKKIPEAKKLTKWEKYAQEKGFENKKRSRRVFDEITKTYVPRWGPGSIKHIQNEVDIIREAKPGQDPNEDPFSKDAKKKKIQKERQNINELKNKLESKGIAVRGQGMDRARGKGKGKVQGGKLHEKKQQNSKMLQIAQGSTASMGLFDKKSHKEEPALKKKIKNVAPTFKNAKEESRRNLDILDQVNRNQGSAKVSR